MENSTGNKPSLQTLFAEYDLKDKRVDELKAAIIAAEKDRSEVVRSITLNYGKGPFRRGGKDLKVVIRGETHFFRGGKNDVIKVDE